MRAVHSGRPLSCAVQLLCLAQHHAANVYADGDYETYKGMLVVAFDGKPTIHKVR